jgi:hypothetical protein
MKITQAQAVKELTDKKMELTARLDVALADYEGTNYFKDSEGEIHVEVQVNVTCCDDPDIADRNADGGVCLRCGTWV